MLFNSIWAILIWMLLYENAWEQIYYVAKIGQRKKMTYFVIMLAAWAILSFRFEVVTAAVKDSHVATNQPANKKKKLQTVKWFIV